MNKLVSVFCSVATQTPKLPVGRAYIRFVIVKNHRALSKRLRFPNGAEAKLLDTFAQFAPEIMIARLREITAHAFRIAGHDDAENSGSRLA